MRADIRTPLQPSLPGGTANTPGVGSETPPALLVQQRAVRRARKQLGNLRREAAAAQGAGPRTAAPLIQELHYAPVGVVTDPQTLQEKRELLEYFQKLQVLVPSLPKTGKIPKLEIIEHVISYIKKLESDLIDHPMIQVLENNAYISGLLQSMAPEFDISHLFPTARSTQPNSPSNTSSSLDQSEYMSGSTSYHTFNPSLRPLNKTNKSSHRKPFSILSTANTK